MTLLKCFYFSFLCTFDIGFRDINIGRWLRKLPPWEGTIEEHDVYTRMISGTQSIICVYLLALFFLSYFGNPFAGW